MEFKGFTPETARFFRSLKRNNTKEWFDRNKDRYEKVVLEPARAFVTAMGGRLKTLSEGIIADPRINKSLFRINRDTRFSTDKSPYKTNMGIYFWEGPRKRMECPGFYVHLDPKEFFLASGLYVFPKNLIDPFRRAVMHPEKGKKLAQIIRKLTTEKGMTVGGTHYKRIPSGYDAMHANAEFLLYNGLYAGERGAVPPEFITPGFVDYCFQKFKILLPLHRWLVDSLM